MMMSSSAQILSISPRLSSHRQNVQKRKQVGQRSGLDRGRFARIANRAGTIQPEIDAKSKLYLQKLHIRKKIQKCDCTCSLDFTVLYRILQMTQHSHCRFALVSQKAIRITKVL
jgi:hypothetical protein